MNTESTPTPETSSDQSTIDSPAQESVTTTYINSWQASLEKTAERQSEILAERFPSVPWQVAWGGHTLGYWSVAVGFLLAFLVVGYGFRQILLAVLGRFGGNTKTSLDDALLAAVRRVKFGFIALLGVLVTISIFINGPRSLIAGAIAFLVVWQAALSINAFIKCSIKNKIDRLPEEEGNKASALSLIATMAQVVVWVFGGLMLLANFGINVTSLVAGLGIGGLAVALALQTVLSDLLSSFSIYFDKPFKVGDFIVVGDKMGTVQKIGIKTTRLRSLSGEELIVPNGQMTSAIVQNYKRMEERRVVLEVGVVYSTSPETLREITTWAEEIIGALEIVRFDRAHFKSFGDSALVFEIVYFVLNSDYTTYMDIQQKINLELLEKFNTNGVEIAFPTQTLYLAKS